MDLFWYPTLTLVIALVLYLGSWALILWILYRIITAAVRNGILEADRIRDRKANPGGRPTA